MLGCTETPVEASVLYENDWDNELHPTEAGFRSLARKIATVI